MTLKIIGAGMAGLLAASMLHRRNPVIYERQATLPNNHSSVLRFRSSVVGDTVGIPFRKVSMIKDALPWRNPVADALSYSMKNTGVRRSDRSITQGLVTEERWIAPPDLIAQIAATIKLQPGYEEDFLGAGPFISTIPMPTLMDLLGHEHKPEFHHQPAINVRAVIANTDAYVSLLTPDPRYPFSRISLTGSEMIVECPGEADRIHARTTALQAADLLGIDDGDVLHITAHRSDYAKIIPIDEDQRKRFLAYATTEHNIYSVGRYATWKPKLLLDDVVQDVRIIEGWLNAGHHYDINKRKVS